jgi:glycosyltransferase involved in cell wall biosynthesis
MNPSARPARIAIVHYWLLNMRGGEKVLERLCRLFPEADLFTLVAEPSGLSPTLLKHKIQTSFLQKIGGKRHYQKMLPLMPFALESFDLRAYDVVISSEAGPAKGVITRPDAVHLCYCHSPMRYIWDLYPEYRAQAGRLTRWAMSVMAPLLRTWDVTTAARVDHFVANSHYVALRIRKFYRREAEVIHPPVDMGRFQPGTHVGDFYLCAGQITPYKRVDLAIEACTRLGRPLVVVGSGATPSLKNLAGPTVRFIDRADDATMAQLFATCRALIYPGLEDFGILPLEVAASGRPVLAYGRGGALETVVDGITGLHFDEQAVAAVVDAIERFEAQEQRFDPAVIRRHALGFDNAHFDRRLLARVLDLCEKAGLPAPRHNTPDAPCER